ncbi:transposase [Duganella sp. LX47W]|uniref:Transposase n=1 Tax=Rugamonas apoptosis TaxID=2758570 RepID=A0A7W2FBX8_9BURK|nr:transposase [Rugamonas apoptosis]
MKIPKLRSGSYFPDSLESRRTAEKALTAVIQEVYIQGISTRAIDELVQSHGHERRVQEPGVATVRGDRRTRSGIPTTSYRG